MSDSTWTTGQKSLPVTGIALLVTVELTITPADPIAICVAPLKLTMALMVTTLLAGKKETGFATGIQSNPSITTFSQ